eukprot:TRINITY_DN22970_c0_g1_i1.p1 TRINITY_DN22970_c0_g1~~TRINITY_DN22970_c0_g1_i1.p1  ORF type:complete len:396 (-),score=45.31 TRINITY_DN22970_c0_g1_i1:155-1342(-)
MSANAAIQDLPKNPTMRDINDVCLKHGIPSLAQGMIELAPPLELRKMLAEVTMEEEVHCYRNRFGEAEYRQAMVKLLKEQYNTELSIDNVLATQGVSGGIVSSLSLLKATDRNTRVALLEPFYTYHLLQIQRTLGSSADIIYVKSKGDNWDLDFEGIEKLLAGENKIDVMILTNPNNPSTRVYSKADVSKLVELVTKHNTTLIVDECYLDLVWDHENHPFYSPIQDGTQDNVIVCRGFSKVLGCQSWRIGYCVSTPKTIADLMRVADPFYICTPFSQHALARYIDKHGSKAFDDHSKEVGALMCDNWKKISTAMEEVLGWTPIQPQGTMYGMFRHGDENGDMAACITALKAGVGVCPGSIFYGNSPVNTGFVRIHCGVGAEKAEKVVNALKANKK